MNINETTATNFIIYNKIPERDCELYEQTLHIDRK